MALSLIQPGTGGALCVFAAPMPDVRGVPDVTTAPTMPSAARAGLGPVPCIVAVNARGAETPAEILAFAKAKTGRDALWWAALIGVSRGCQRIRELWIAGAAALALILIDGMAGQKPPTAIQLGFAQTVTALARSGAILLVVTHTYISQGPKITSTAEMARLATGWALAAPPAGETVRRVQDPTGAPSGWRGGLVVYSTASGPADANAHRDQMQALLPLILADRVRPLVDLPERPDVVASLLPASSPEPTPEAGPWSHLPAITAASTSAPTAAPGAAPSRGADRLRFLLIGDSLAQGLGPELARIAAKVGVGFAGEGVKSSTIGQWLGGTALTDAIERASRQMGGDPTAALVVLGTNDMRLADPGAEGHRAGELVTALRRNGVASVRWIAPPAMPFDAPAFREALATEASARGVRIFDSAALVPPLERGPGQIHLTPAGYRAWADKVAAWVPFEGLPAAEPDPSRASPSAPLPAPANSPRPPLAQGRLSGTPLPAPRPRAPGEGRATVDPSATLGERAAQFALEEQRDGVHEDPPHSNRSPRIDQYRHGLGSPGDNWCGFGFCYSAAAVLQPGEALPHAYSGRVAEIVRTGKFHPKADGYAPRQGDGAVYRRGGQDPTKGGNGHIGRVLLPPDAAGTFEDIEANSGDAWAQRVHHVDEPDFLGWLEYPQGPGDKPVAQGVPASIVVEDMGALPFEEYVARVVTAELGESWRQPQALAALAMAARTFAVWMMRNEGLGTVAKPMPNSAKKQVVAGAPTALATEAARATKGGLILYKHQPILACHNAGAIWLPGALTGAGGRDDSRTEHNITYNQGLAGRQVKSTPIARGNLDANRGCLSQNGADALAARGYTWAEILRYFYGQDIDFSIPAPAGRRTPPASRPRPAPRSGGDLLPLAAGLGLAVKLVLG